MINEVKRAVDAIEKLPRDQQIEIAQLIQDELSWDKAFQNNQKELSTLANEALREYKDGKTSDQKW